MKRFLVPSVLIAASTLSAATLYWDGTGTSTTPTGTANGVSQGNGGTFSATSAVWDNGTAYQTWNPTGNTAVFGATGTGTGGTIILTGFTSTSTTFNGTNSWSLSGDLSGLTGTIYVNTGNTNQAKVNYTSGVSNLGATGAVNVNVASGSTWYQSTSTGANVSLTLAGVGNGEGLGAARLDNITFGGGITLAAAADLGVYSGTTTVSGVISDGGNNYTLTKVATGTLNLSGINTFTGNIVVSNGALAITGAGQLGSGSYAGAITTAAGKTFTYGSSATQVLSGAITNSGTLSASAGNLTLSGSLANTGAISVSGGTTTISGTVSGSGATTVSGGTLALDYTTDNTSKLSTGALTLSGGTLALTGNAAADTTQTVGSLSLTGAASLSLATQAGRTLTFDNSAGTRSGNGSLNLTTTGSGTGVFKFAGTTANSALGWATWNGVAFAKTDSLNQVTAAGQSTLNASSADLSTWTSGATQYTTTGAAFTNSVGAGVTIDGVTFQDAAARTVTIGTGNTLTLNGGVIVTSGVGANVSTITGGTIRGSASGVLSLLNNNTSSSLTVESAIADNGGATGLAKYGAGTVIIKGDSNAFSGPVTVNGGELRARVFTDTAGGARSTLGSGVITVNNGSNLRFQAGSNTYALSYANAINLNGSNFYHDDGVMTMSGTVTSTGTSTLNGVWGGKNGIFSNVVVSSGALTLQGASSDTITALNIASGASFTATQSGVSIGTIAGAGSFTYSSGGNLTITGDNSALGYSGNISFGATGGTFLVNSGAKLVTSGSFGQGWSKTNTINGTLSVGGNLDFGTAATTSFNGSGTTNVTGSGSYFGLNNSTTLNFSSTGSLNVQQGNVVIGAGTAGANTLNQSAGTINALGLQLGSSGVTTAQTYALTGGRINLGANGITSVGTGTRTINLGAGTVGAQSNWSSSLAISLTNAATGVTFNTLDSVDGVTGRTITLSTGLSGTGALVKAGAGTLILSGNNTYTGATTVNAGTLRLSGTNTSAITVNSGGTLSVASAATATTTGLLTMNTGATLAADASTTNAFTSNGVNFAGATSLLFNSALTSNSTYLVLNYGAGGVTNLANLAAKARGTLTDDLANSRITFTAGTAGTRTWNTTSGTWDNLTTANFSEGDQMFSNGDTVVFSDPASAAVVTLVGQLVPASVSVNNTNDYTFSGTGFIAGTSTLTKAGTGKLTLSTANTYTGATTINAGTLEIAGSGTLGGGAYAGVITNAGTLRFNTTANQTLSGGGSGAGALVKDNTGTLSLSANNGFTGGITVNGGVLALTGGGGGTGTIRGVVTVNAGGTLSTSVSNSFGYNGGAKIDILNINGGTVTTSVVGDNGWGITVNMTGGNLSSTVNGGYFSMGGGASINTLDSASTATIGANLRIREGNTNNRLAFTVADGAAATDLLVSGVISEQNGSGIAKEGAGRMLLTGVNTYAGATLVNAGTLEIGGAGQLGSGNYAGAITIASGATLRHASSAAQTFAGSIGGGGTLDVASGSTLTWDGSSSGGLTIAGSGTLKVGSGAPVWGQGGATTYAMTGGQIRVEGGTLTVASGGDDKWTNNKSALYVASGATFDGVESSGNSDGGIFVDALTGSGTVKVGYTGYVSKITFGVNNGTGTFDGVLANSQAAGNYTKAGTGTQTLTGVNTYTGATAITGGVLEIGGAGQLGSGAYAGAIANAGTLKLNSTAAQTLSGVISGSGALQKANSGTLTLSAINTYSGGTTLTGGKIVTGNGAALGTGAVSVAGGTLQIGAGNLAGIASLTVNTGTLDTTLGTVTTTGAFALAGGTWVIGNTADAITAGSFTLTGGVIDLTGFTNKSNAGTYSLISGTGSSSFTDANFTNGDAGFSYAIDGNGDLVVTAVPEPSTYGLLGAGALAAAAFVRRRRKAKVA